MIPAYIMKMKGRAYVNNDYIKAYFDYVLKRFKYSIITGRWINVIKVFYSVNDNLNFISFILFSMLIVNHLENPVLGLSIPLLWLLYHFMVGYTFSDVWESITDFSEYGNAFKEIIKDLRKGV